MFGKLSSHFRRNIVGYIALFVALGGTGAYASHLVVRSSDIVNDEVRSADVRNDTSSGGGLSGVDVSPNSLTGGDIAESSLGAVPQAEDADSLGGTPASGYARGFSTQGTFGVSDFFVLTVPGVGRVTVTCDDGDSPSIDSDDTVFPVFQNQSGSTATVGWGTQVEPTGEDTQTVNMAANGTQSFGLAQTRRQYGDLVVVPSNGRTATFHVSAAEIASSTDCRGAIHAVRSG